MTKPPKPWTESETLQYFCRHLVALCVTFQRKGEDHTHFAAYSGTLILIHSRVFLLTAGHILEDLDKVRKSADVEITNAVLADTFGLERISDIPIPFDLKSAESFHIDNEEEGLDFGVISLSRYYVNLLAKNGVVALEEKNWINQANVSFDGYVMLGLPEEIASKYVNDAGEGLVEPTMFGVRRLDPPPDDTPVTTHPRFVGQISAETPIKSVVGMSGGPIFGFRFGEQTQYWVVALQSTWIPSRRIVYGCSLPILATLMTQWANDSASKE
jgi:hypothetical protein